MGSTDKFVSAISEGGGPAEECTIDRVERALAVIEGRWKLLIVHHLFVRQPLRFSQLERAIRTVTQKMLVQQLRALEADGVVERIAYPVVPPRVEYRLTPAGAALEPALNALHDWAASEHLTQEPATSGRSDTLGERRRK